MKQKITKELSFFSKILGFRGLSRKGTIISEILACAFLWHISQDKTPTLLPYQKSLKTTVQNEYICEEACHCEVTTGHTGTLSDLSSCPSCNRFNLPLQEVDIEEFYHFSRSVSISSILGLVFKFTEVTEASRQEFFEFVIPVVLHPCCNLCSHKFCSFLFL